MSRNFIYCCKPPFRKVLFHRIEPLTLIDYIGLDLMRLSILMVMSKDGDLKLSIKNFDIGKKICTKLWNIARYLYTNNVFDTNTNIHAKQEKISFENLDKIDIKINFCLLN